MVELYLWKQQMDYLKSSKNRFGDFQTNLQLCEKVCLLLQKLGSKPDIIIEPTCGIGNFIKAASALFPNRKKIIGIEIQKEHVRQALKNIDLCNQNDEIEIINHSIFDYNFKTISKHQNKEFLLLGNLPWITNSDLKGENLPLKLNLKKWNGMDARTGKANFDISEYILFALLKQFHTCRGYIGFLCKTQVVKNIIAYLPKTNIKVGNFQIYLFNSKKEFQVNVDACLFICKLQIKNDYLCSIYDIEKPTCMKQTFGIYKNKFVSHVEKYKKYSIFDGKSNFIWRSGIKHDCSKIMELQKVDTLYYRNKNNEILELEEDLIYPLVKSSSLKGNIIENSNTKVILTQKKIGESTHYISLKYPKIWKYLISKQELFSNRKSSIYKDQPHFSIFGIGDYSFYPYKIGISGLYKKPSFTLLISQEKTLILDDTCYFIGFNNLKKAFIIFYLLQSKKTKLFLESITFIEAKRPYTKEILMRIDLRKVLSVIGNIYNINKMIENLKFPKYRITKNDYLSFENELKESNPIF